MPGLTLETIHPDAIVEILSSSENFRDLHRLLASSPVCFRVFNCSSITILTRVARSIIGDDAWQEATTVLTYQRHNIAGTIFYPGVEKDLASDFVLEKTDIPHLLANQQFFSSCSKNYGRYLLPDRPRTLGITLHHSRLASLSMSPTSFLGVPLKTKFFYQSWQLSLQYGHESIGAFARRKNLTPQQTLATHFLSRIMIVACNFDELICPPRWSTKVFGWHNPFWCDMFTIFGNGHFHISFKSAMAKNVGSNNAGYNHLLYMKAMSHLAASTAKSNPGFERRDFCLLVNEFQADYSKMSLEALVTKYGLNVGSWE